jgi:hypothetical protein
VIFGTGGITTFLQKKNPVPRPTSVKPMLHGLKSYQYSTIGVFGDMVQQSPYGIQTG